MSVVLGFTGTRQGMSLPQLNEVAFSITCYGPDWGVHGGARGADLQFHEKMLRQSIRCEVWPAVGSDLPGWMIDSALGILPAKPPLERNHDIVAACTLLIACPAQDHEILRSGTWATIRYARKAGKPVKVIAPDGKVTMHPIKGWRDPFTGKVRDPL
jgi:hypothetical protein